MEAAIARQKKPEANRQARAAILEAAERHCAQRGLGPSSVRAIASAANVNSAMLGYYFGPKETLLRELVLSAAQKISAWRLAALEKLHAEYGDAIPVAEIIRAYAEPFLIEDHPLAETVKVYLRVVGQAMSEPGARLSDYVHEQFLETHLRFVAEIGRSTPGVASDRIASRYHMMVGAMVSLCAGREWATDMALFGRSIPATRPDDVLSRFSEEWGRIFALS